MKKNSAKNKIYFDCDWTLINPETGKGLIKNIERLKSYKSNGNKIIVWSHSGADHAEEVVKLLQLEEFVDIVEAKPMAIIDDEAVEDWTILIKVKGE